MKKPCFTPAYVVGIYPYLCKIARKHGYALALHGSLVRDLDLVAIPWTDKASDASTLILAIGKSLDIEPNHPYPFQKPHGRIAWTLPLWWGAYLDISVMPKSKD